MENPYSPFVRFSSPLNCEATRVDRRQAADGIGYALDFESHAFQVDAQTGEAEQLTRNSAAGDSVGRHANARLTADSHRQPVTGYVMMRIAGFPTRTPWLAWSIALYVFAMAYRLPVVWIQMRLSAEAQVCATSRTRLSGHY
jgi:uncharacterized membrane protein